MRRRPATITAVIATITGLAALGGCYRNAFNDNEPRTQFETYDRVRNRFTPLTVTDAFGRQQPALRARLGERD